MTSNGAASTSACKPIGQGCDHRRLVDPSLRDATAVDDDHGDAEAELPLEVALAVDLHDPGPGTGVEEDVLGDFAEMASAAGVKDDVHGRRSGGDR